MKKLFRVVSEICELARVAERDLDKVTEEAQLTLLEEARSTLLKEVDIYPYEFQLLKEEH